MSAKRISLLALPLLITLLFGSAHAYFNITQVNTTVVLSSNTTTASVIETFYLYMSNASVNVYAQDRSAYNLSLVDWQNILKTTQLTPHILNPRFSVSKLTFLPGSIIPQGSGADALLIMTYSIKNVTTVDEIAPRKFEYTFNDSVLNFEHTASGQALPQNVRFTLVVPKGAQIVSISPLPDSPPPNFVGNYTNVTAFSWYAAEPLYRFSFSYILTQSLQGEVAAYFTNIYTNDKEYIYIGIVVLLLLSAAYIYIKFLS